MDLSHRGSQCCLPSGEGQGQAPSPTSHMGLAAPLLPHPLPCSPIPPTNPRRTPHLSHATLLPSHTVRSHQALNFYRPIPPAANPVHLSGQAVAFHKASVHPLNGLRSATCSPITNPSTWGCSPKASVHPPTSTTTCPSEDLMQWLKHRSGSHLMPPNRPWEKSHVG